MKPRTGRALDPASRVTCQYGACNHRAVMLETVPHAGGVSFYHYCLDCWHAPAANGGPSPAERTTPDPLATAVGLLKHWLERAEGADGLTDGTEAFLKTQGES